MSRTAKLINIGEEVGVVTVVGRVYNEKRKEWEYMCECRCGNRFKSRRDHLLKPRQGCRACINKVKSDMNLSNTISEDEFNKIMALKNLEKIKKKELLNKVKEDRARAKEEKLLALREKKEKFKNSRLSSPCWLGQRFGRLVVIDCFIDNGKSYWILRCDCGNIVTKLAKLVKYGSFISCGCISKEISANSVSNERLYGIWCGIKSRCLNANNKNFHNYGGRGISICEEWKNSYQAFRDWAYQNGWLEDIPKKHEDILSIERIDVNGNYCPENCCFIPLKQQCFNKRPYNECRKKITKKDKNIITINGIAKSQREWQEHFNISDSMLAYRIKKGISIENALVEPKFSKNILYK